MFTSLILAIQTIAVVIRLNYVKTNKVKGFSIEGYFADKLERPKDKTIKDDLEFDAQKIVDELKSLLSEI